MEIRDKNIKEKEDNKKVNDKEKEKKWRYNKNEKNKQEEHLYDIDMTVLNFSAKDNFLSVNSGVIFHHKFLNVIYLTSAGRERNRSCPFIYNANRNHILIYIDF